MAHFIVDLLREYLARYGYWAVAATLLLENAGLPVPGETILLLASFLAFSEHRLRLPYVILVAVCAATVGDNLGFWIGLRGGRPLLNRYRHILHVPPQAVERGERLIQRYGAVAILFARFVAGVRIVAGPLAGVLRMDWKKFALFNFLGASLWVTTISMAGYFSGRHWGRLLRLVKRLDVAIVIAVVLGIFFLWRRRQRESIEPDLKNRA
jgi:membrane protein DedA with SNARE-associated domain